MAKGRKTIEVKWMLNWANKQLAYEGHSEEHKAGICTMIERLLMDTGNYEGYYELEYGSEYTNQYCRCYYTSANLT